MLDFARLEASVSNIDSRIDSAVAVLNAVAQEIRDNLGNQAKLGALADDLDNRATALGAAIDNVNNPPPSTT